MNRIVTKCPKCETRQTVIREAQFPGMSLTCLHLECGHSIYRKETAKAESIDVERWDDLDPYQKQGVEFIENANYKALIGDERGLGKTVQALMAIKRNRANLEPVLYVTKSAVKTQFAYEIGRWLLTKGENPMEIAPQIINGGNDDFLYGIFNHFVISMSLLSKKRDDIIEKLKPKTIVVDESQNFKTMGSNRTQALVKIIQELNPNLIYLSGSPILNHAMEFFFTLHTLAPNVFPTLSGFEARHLSWDGRSIRNPERFHSETSHFILRREKKDVFEDLPAMRRVYNLVEIENQQHIKAYGEAIKKLKAFLEEMNEKDTFAASGSLLAILTHLRQITALAKIPLLGNYLQTLAVVEGKLPKLLIGIHHKVVSTYLYAILKELGFNPLVIDGETNAKGTTDDVKKAFIEKDEHRVLICSMLACGEGLDGLQHVCSEMIVLERQWNREKEKQFEGRLDRRPFENRVTATYFLAKRTIDEYFTATVNLKDEHVKSALDPNHEENFALESDFARMKELAWDCVNGFRGWDQ